MSDKKETKKVVGPPLREGDPRLSVKDEPFTEKAFGMFRMTDKEAGKWAVVTLSYDFKSNQAKIELIEDFENKSFAFNKFRTKVANEF